MTRRASRRCGFTLFEVVGVVLVTALVVGAATNYYIDLSRASNRAAATTRDIRHATAILDRVARDFESTLLVVKPAEMDPLSHPWLFVAEARHGESGADHIKFITRNFQPRRSEEHESDLTVVAYTVRTSEENDTLEVFRWTDPRLPEALDRSFPSEDDEASVLLAEGLADFGVRFYDDAGDEKDDWDSTTLVESGSLPTSVEITVGMADPNATGEDLDDVVRYSRRVLLPVRPLDLEALLDPNLLGGAGEGDEEDGEDDDAESGGEADENPSGLTLGDCIDVPALIEEAQATMPALVGYIQASLSRPWSEVEGMIPDELAPFVLSAPGCVLFFALLLTASIATFLKRSTVDAILSRNRDAMARAEALARGGSELAKALLIDDRVRDTSDPGGSRLDTPLDSWAQVANTEIDAGDGARLRLRIEDSGSRLNLNALFRFGENVVQPPRTQLFLLAFLEKMIEELPVDEQDFYERGELAENLIDYVDSDEVRIGGGFEDDYYQRQTPPYRAANRPLLSVDELGLVEGFDAALVDVIRPYVTVYPFVGGGGVNPNTAAPHILALIFYHNGVDTQLADEEDVHRMLRIRESGQLFCPDQSNEACTPISGILPNAATIHPPLSYFSDAFTVRSEAQVGEVRRTLETVIDRTTPSEPLLLSWKMR